jgi:Tfp pilus assembly protein PilO
MGRIQEVFTKVREYKYTKYIVTLFFFILIVGFIDENSFWNRRGRISNIEKLEHEIKLLKNQYDEDTKKLRSLEEYENVVRLAREKYLMKRPNEDVFIFVEE